VLGRSRFRDRGRGSGVGGSNLLNQATIYLGGVAPFHWLDFINNRALYAGIDVGNVTGATGYSFSRASQGYYTNSDGTLTLFGYNLLLRSQEFDDAAWSKTRSSITANATTAPDGTLTADKLVEDTSTNTHFVLNNSAVTVTSGAPAAYSVFLKAGERTIAQVLDNDLIGATFDLASGVVTDVPAGVTATITSLANGWYRCTMARDAGSANGRLVVRLVSTGTTSSYTGNGTSGLFIWGAQLEPSASLGSYVPTTTSAAGALRRGDRGVLIEGARTNLLLQSQTFNNASWIKAGGASVTADAIAAPDGTLTADLIAENATTNNHQINQNYTYTATAHTISAHVKYKDRQWMRMMFYDGAAFRAGWFDVLNGVAGTLDAGVTSTITALGNGWFRISITRTTAAGSGGVYIHGALTNGGPDDYLGETGKGFYLWGAQLEAASFPSSYVPTTSAAVNRASDVLTYTAGVTYPIQMWSEFERAVDTGGNEWLLQMDAGTDSDRSILFVDIADRMAAITVNGGSEQSNQFVAGSLAALTVYKGALRVATNDVKVARSGTLSSGDVSALTPATPTTIRIGRDAPGAVAFWGYVRRVAIIQGAGSDANLQGMTS
jgi:hypothetical protein